MTLLTHATSTAITDAVKSVTSTAQSTLKREQILLYPVVRSLLPGTLTDEVRVFGIDLDSSDVQVTNRERCTGGAIAWADRAVSRRVGGGLAAGVVLIDVQHQEHHGQSEADERQDAKSHRDGGDGRGRSASTATKELVLLVGGRCDIHGDDGLPGCVFLSHCHCLRCNVAVQGPSLLLERETMRNEMFRWMQGRERIEMTPWPPFVLLRQKPESQSNSMNTWAR